MLLVFCGAAAHACLWDRDTLEYEAKRFPGVVDVIVGAFDRNPPLYYEMRLERVRREIAKNPENLPLYDDAAVSCDRLGDHGEAIKWMQRKRERMGNSPKDNDAEYKYYANIGTFEAHLWFARGKPQDKSLLQKARDDIQKAIQINSDAHFGRERVQLLAIDWALHPREGEDLWTYLDRKDVGRDAAKGLAGLVVLGNAWESVDVFYALSEALEMPDASLALLAKERCIELIKAGHSSVNPKLPKGDALIEYWRLGSTRVIEGLSNHVRSEYVRLRRVAEARHQTRTEFMLTRLRAGRHPDTDPAFWDGFRPPGPLEIHPTPTGTNLLAVIRKHPLTATGVSLLVIAATLLIVKKVRLRRHLKASVKPRRDSQ